MYSKQSWKVLRESFLSTYPLCKVCQQLGVIRVATIVDHITPHKGNSDLFFDADNLQSLCKRHHDKKTNAEKQSG
jgi:5-methylcytosine-specific restriction endonuclease McrA